MRRMRADLAAIATTIRADLRMDSVQLAQLEADLMTDETTQTQVDRPDRPDLREKGSPREWPRLADRFAT